MRFEVCFCKDNREQLTITGRLTNRELETIEWFRKSGRADPNATAMDMALRHAYAEAPPGFIHAKASVRLTPDP
jgi:hypothetical protein